MRSRKLALGNRNIVGARVAARRLELGARRSHISISHERQHAVALVILED